MVSPAYRAVLEPLIEQLQRRLGLGVFKDIVSLTPAKSIHGAVWAAGSRRQWATDHRERDEVREHALRFCLCGVAPETIAQIVARSVRRTLRNGVMVRQQIGASRWLGRRIVVPITLDHKPMRDAL
jgi:hypothetical protein